MPDSFEALRRDREFMVLCGALMDYVEDRETPPPGEPFDGARFAKLALRHWVVPVIYHQTQSWLRTRHSAAMQSLQAFHRWNAINVSRMGSEIPKLVDRLSQAGITVWVLKGIPLAALAYRHPSDRQ